MSACPPQEAPARLWLEFSWLSCGLTARGGRPVTRELLLTLWSKGHCSASPAGGHAGSRASPRRRLPEIEEETTCWWPFWRMSFFMFFTPRAAAFRSVRPLWTEGKFFFFRPVCSFWSYCITADVFWVVVLLIHLWMLISLWECTICCWNKGKQSFHEWTPSWWH